MMCLPEGGRLPCGSRPPCVYGGEACEMAGREGRLLRAG